MDHSLLAVILGIIEGLTEFLPISSTAHMKFANPLIGEGESTFREMFEVVIQLAAANDIPVIEAQLNPEVLRQADEVFVTNAIGGIRWVMGYGRKRYFNENAKNLSALLNSISTR